MEVQGRFTILDVTDHPSHHVIVVHEFPFRLYLNRYCPAMRRLRLWDMEAGMERGMGTHSQRPGEFIIAPDQIWDARELLLKCGYVEVGMDYDRETMVVTMSYDSLHPSRCEEVLGTLKPILAQNDAKPTGHQHTGSTVEVFYSAPKEKFVNLRRELLDAIEPDLRDAVKVEWTGN